eukprot:COSAG06_NODE_191_length_20709_cov_8.536778_5_plen_1153_part_00
MGRRCRLALQLLLGGNARARVAQDGRLEHFYHPGDKMISSTVSRMVNPLAGGGGGDDKTDGLVAHGMRGVDGSSPTSTPTHAHVALAQASCPVRLSDARLEAELVESGLLSPQKLADLTEAFEVVAAPDPAVRTISLPELRAILRLLGCERVASALLHDLQALESYRHGRIRRPPLSYLQGLDLLAALPPPGRSSLSLVVTPGTAREAEEMRINFDDFLRILSRGKVRAYLPTLHASSGVHTLTLLGAIYDLAVQSAGRRTIDRSDLMVACAGVNTHLSQPEMDELWGILANADIMSTERAGAGAVVKGWLIRRGQARKKRIWCTLNETGRGRLQFRDEEHSAATSDFLEMAHCVRVYHAAGHHSRREFFGLFGGKHDTTEVDRVTAQLQEVWNQLDEDGDGSLKEPELRTMLQRMGTTMTDKKFRRWMKQVDSDRNGCISLEELEFWFRKQSEEARNLLAADARDLDELWSEIDTDGSGELDKEELAAVLDIMGQPMGPRKLENMMQRLDTDGNGTVSKAEFSVWWRKQSEEARSQVALAADTEDDEAEAEADADDESKSTTIALVMRQPRTLRERNYMFETSTKEEMKTWLEALEECRLFHHNYDRQHIHYGEFLLGMATVPSTPLADRFDMFASSTGTRRHRDGTESQTIQRSTSALVDRPVDDVRADELFEKLGAMEKFGVAVVKREQKKRDRTEMMARLQRANHNQLHALTPAEQRLMLHIERWVVIRCFIYGALSAIGSGLAELLIGYELDTSDGLHHGTAYLAPNATCDADPSVCEPLDHWTMAHYWIFAIVLPIVLCSIAEIGAIYIDSLRSAMRFVGVVGMQLLPLDDARLFIALSLTRAVLELGNPEDAMTGILDPLREMNKLRMLVCTVLYKARIGISNFVLKIGMKRVISRSVARSALPFAAVVGTAVWNGLTARQLMTEARIRAMGVASSVEISNEIIERFVPNEMTPLGKLQAARAVACTVVQKRTLHPNHHHLLLHILHHVGLEQHEARVSMHSTGSNLSETEFDSVSVDVLDCAESFLRELPNLNEEESAMVVGLVCLSIVIDARAQRRSLAFYAAVLEALRVDDAAFPDSALTLEQIALEFSRGKPLDAEALIAAVGKREPRESQETVQRTCAESLAYWPWHVLSRFVTCFTQLV